MIPTEEALKRLHEGNSRFVSDSSIFNKTRSIVDRIRPSLTSLLKTDQDPDILLQQAVRANIHSSVNQLQHGSEIL